MAGELASPWTAVIAPAVITGSQSTASCFLITFMLYLHYTWAHLLFYRVSIVQRKLQVLSGWGLLTNVETYRVELNPSCLGKYLVLKVTCTNSFFLWMVSPAGWTPKLTRDANRCLTVNSTQLSISPLTLYIFKSVIVCPSCQNVYLPPSTVKRKCNCGAPKTTLRTRHMLGLALKPLIAFSRQDDHHQAISFT